MIQASLVSAYLNEDQPRSDRPLALAPLRPDGLDRRRRDLAATLIRQLSSAAVRGSDGTATWIGPVLNLTGWAVEPLIPDTYTGLAGLAVLFAAYQRETAAGRADALDEAPALLAATLRTMRAADNYVTRRRSQTRTRPPAAGGYVGIGSQIWAWLTLYQWGEAPDGLARARALAGVLPAAAAASDSHDLLTGMAGAIVPLLQLSWAAGEQRWRHEAAVIGGRLGQAAQRQDGAACWTSPRWPSGVGGFAHGVTGIGWALARLYLATGQEDAAATARAAFAFEESLYDPDAGGWLDLRDPGRHTTAATWCHGAVGIGLAALDLAARGWDVPPSVLGRAVTSTERDGFGWNHTLCHGDLGSWELIDTALAARTAPGETARRRLAARVITSLEATGPVTGLTREVFTPGLVPGLSGIAYQLLRLHPASDLPSVLIQATS